MAKSKKNTIEKDLVSNIDKMTDDITLPQADEVQREMILDLLAKGFDTNRIAARLEIRKDIVENTINKK